MKHVCLLILLFKDDIISIVQQTYQKSIESGLDGNTGTMPCIVDTLATDQHFLDIAKVKVSEMFKKENILLHREDIFGM